MGHQPAVPHQERPLLAGHALDSARRAVGEWAAHLGPERHTVQWSPDGIHFTRAAKVRRVHTGCGPYDLDAFTGAASGRGITWGVAQDAGRGKPVHIIRFDVDLLAPKPAETRVK